MKTQLHLPLLRALAIAWIASSSFAQTTFTEVEPNADKPSASMIGPMVAGDMITGTCTGSDNTLGSTLETTVDYMRVKIAPLPLAIYRHRLEVTPPTTNWGPSIRGGSQQNIVQGVGSSGCSGESIIQTASATTTPVRFSQWYGFGKGEEFYYRVQGTTATTGGYTATLSTFTTGVTAIPGVYDSNVTITGVGQTNVNTQMNLYDSNLDPVANNEGGQLFLPSGTAGASVARINLCLPPGTYYVVHGQTRQTNELPANRWEVFGGANTCSEFPGMLVINTNTTTVADWDFLITDGVTTTPVVNQSPTNTPFERVWYSFVVGTTITPLNDNCANATPISIGQHNGFGLVGNLAGATNDGSATCDTGGTSSKDMWYSVTNGPIASTLQLDTCGTGSDLTIAAFAGCGGAQLACSDDCTGTPCTGTDPCMTVVLSPNQTVRIRVSDKGLGGGCFIMNVKNPPLNDDCATPTVLVGPGSVPFDTRYGTTGTQGQAAVAPCTNTPKGDLWYTYSPSTDGTVTVASCLGITGSGDNTIFSIYAGAGCPTAPGIACNDTDTTCTGNTGRATVSFPAVCGADYTIQLGEPFAAGGQTTPIFGTFSITEAGGTTTCFPTTHFCLGDGTGAPCPCANPGAVGHGCASTAFAGGAILSRTGFAGASVGTDTLVLTATDIPGPGLFFQSTGLAASPFNFGDGHLCASVGIVRLGVVFPTANAASYPGGTTPNQIHIAGGTTAGDVRHYQCWYRANPGLCTPENFDLTQGLTLTWQP